MTTNAIVVATPKQDLSVIQRQADAILLMKQSMKPGVHYGPPYLGSKKETLLKPGAEWLCRRFGLRPHFNDLDKTIAPNFERPDQSFILFRYRCEMIDIESGLVVGEAIGSCNSFEDKYHWRNDKLKCPACGKDVLTKTKKNPEKWWCNSFPDKGGCGANWETDDPQITNQEVGKIVNINPMNELNTIDKMAQKRAMTSAVLVATGGSAYFSPGDDEVKDIYITDDNSDAIDAVFTEVTNEPVTVTTPPPNGAQKTETKPETKPQPPVSEPPPAPPAKDTPYLNVTLEQLMPKVLFMYEDEDEEKKTFHARGSLAKLFGNAPEVDVVYHIKSDDDEGTALSRVFHYRAKKDHELGGADVLKAMNYTLDQEENGNNVKGFGDWFKIGKDYKQLWQAVKDYVDYLELKDTPPSKPKHPFGKPQSEVTAPPILEKASEAKSDFDIFMEEGQS